MVVVLNANPSVPQRTTDVGRPEILGSARVPKGRKVCISNARTNMVLGVKSAEESFIKK